MVLFMLQNSRWDQAKTRFQPNPPLGSASPPTHPLPFTPLRAPLKIHRLSKNAYLSLCFYRTQLRQGDTISSILLMKKQTEKLTCPRQTSDRAKIPTGSLIPLHDTASMGLYTQCKSGFVLTHVNSCECTCYVCIYTHSIFCMHVDSSHAHKWISIHSNIYSHTCIPISTSQKMQGCVFTHLFSERQFLHMYIFPSNLSSATIPS